MAAATIKMMSGRSVFKATKTEYLITDYWIITGVNEDENIQTPAVAHSVSAAAGVPQYRDRHPNNFACRVYNRTFMNIGPLSCEVVVEYSDDPKKWQLADDTSVVTYDLMGRTERQMWDITDPTIGIGANSEGAEVYRPHMSITFEHTEGTPSNLIYTMTGTINDHTYKGFAANTLLFLGARVRESGSVWTVTYQFLFDPGLHKVAWRNYRDEKDADPASPHFGRMVRTYFAPTYLAVVYEEADFWLLPI